MVVGDRAVHGQITDKPQAVDVFEEVLRRREIPQDEVLEISEAKRLRKQINWRILYRQFQVKQKAAADQCGINWVSDCVCCGTSAAAGSAGLRDPETES